MTFQLPRLMQAVPEDLSVCQPLATPAERTAMEEIRKRYARDPAKAVAEQDKIRAFRLLKGMTRYLEVGTFDKFNLRYVSSLLNPSALVIDLDIAENAPAETQLRSEIPATMQYHSVIGDSSKAETLDQVISLSGPEPFDAVFIDANHTAGFVMSDFALYGERVHSDGYVFFHDMRWEGSTDAKGVADALDILQRFVPIYQVLPDAEVSHWHRPLNRGSFWGGVAIVRGRDLQRVPV